MADKEINAHTDLSLKYEPIYGDRTGRGRKFVEQVEFEVFYLTKQEPETATPVSERLVKQFRLQPDQAAQISEMQSIEVINRQHCGIHTKTNYGKEFGQL